MRNSIKRSCGETEAVISWPIERCDWEALTQHVRNQVRDHMDAAIDLIEANAMDEIPVYRELSDAEEAAEGLTWD